MPCYGLLLLAFGCSQLDKRPDMDLDMHIAGINLEVPFSLIQLVGYSSAIVMLGATIFGQIGRAHV